MNRRGYVRTDKESRGRYEVQMNGHTVAILKTWRAVVRKHKFVQAQEPGNLVEIVHLVSDFETMRISDPP